MEPIAHQRPRPAAVGRDTASCSAPGRWRSARCGTSLRMRVARAAGARRHPLAGRRRARRGGRRAGARPARRRALGRARRHGPRSPGRPARRCASASVDGAPLPRAARRCGLADACRGGARRARRPTSDRRRSTQRRCSAPARRCSTFRVDDAAARSARTLRVAALPRGTAHDARRRPGRRGADELLEHVAHGNPVHGARAGPLRARPGASSRVDAGRPRAGADDDRLALRLRRLRGRRPDAPVAPRPADRWPDGPRDAVGRQPARASSTGSTSPGWTPCATSPRTTSSCGTRPSCSSGETFADERVHATPAGRAREHAAHGRELADEVDAPQARRRLQRVRLQRLPRDRLPRAVVASSSSPPTSRSAALAEALLDKILLTLAANSWRGVHGAAHGRSYVPTLRSSRFEETAPIMWPLWGMGSLNAAVLPATALATARALPRCRPVVRAIATDLPDQWEGRQVYRGEYRLHHDLLTGPYGSDLRVWRTPDAMLSSGPGLPRPACPACRSTSGARRWRPRCRCSPPSRPPTATAPRPGRTRWAGQRVLPRARQHRDDGARRCTAHGPPTHLWFPTPLMDEWRQSGPWLAGRRRRRATSPSPPTAGSTPVTRRRGGRPGVDPARRRPRRTSRRSAGRATDGSFARLRRRAGTSRSSAPTTRGDPRVAWTARTAASLDLAWTSPFLVDGRPADLDRDGPSRRRRRI